MFGRVVNAAKLLQHGRHQQMLAKRTFARNQGMAIPPMRHLTFWHQAGMYLFICVAGLAYPTYMVLNIDNLRPPQDVHFSEELKEKLEERRRLRAEGKLNVLQQKV